MRKHRLFEFVKSLSIRTKFFAAALLLLAALFVSACFIGYHTYFDSYEEHLETAQGDFNNCFDSLNKFEKRLVHLSILFQNDSEAVEMLTGMEALSESEGVNRAQEFRPKLYTLLDGSGDYYCRLYVKTPLVSIDNTSNVLPLNTIEDEEWNQKTMSGWGNWRFFSAEELNANTPALAAPIRDMENYLELVGLLRIDIVNSGLTDRLFAPRSEEYVSCFLQTADGTTVAATDSEIESFQLDAPANTLEGFGSYFVNKVRQGKDTVFYRTLPHSHWRLVMVVDHEKLYDSIFPQLSTLIIGGGLLALLGMLCAMPILFSMVARIRRFYRYVRSYSGNALKSVPPPLEPLAEDEIGQLIDAHNALLLRIHEMVEERKRQDRERRHLEIGVLQAQINPHFLYNTLDAILWLSKLNKPDEVESTIRSLTKFYRLCLSKGRSVLPVSQELEIVENYIAIQSTRYGKRFRLSVDVPESILKLELPKITLQPLVENALFHGIMESGREDGWIKITGRMTGGQSELCVMDSGGHFSQEDWDAAMKAGIPAGSDPAGHGYGLHNVERRLCLFFQREQVMRLDRENPEETCIVIPFFAKEEDAPDPADP